MRQGLRTARRRLARLAFERGAAVDTSRPRDLVEWGLDAPGRVDYAPSGWRLLRRALAGRPVTPGHVFADLGCGMGRVVVQAARYPFGRVVGVELVPHLMAATRHNVAAQLGEEQRRKVELVEGDVVAWPVPDDLTHLFLNNPFTGDVLRTVLLNTLESVRRAPRELLLVYANPLDRAVVDGVGGFRLVADLRRRREPVADRILLYRAGPPS